MISLQPGETSTTIGTRALSNNRTAIRKIEEQTIDFFKIKKKKKKSWLATITIGRTITSAKFSEFNSESG